MRLTANVDVGPVASYYHQLSVALRRGLPETLEAEASATVRRAMQMTKHASAKVLREKAWWREMARVGNGQADVTTLSGRRGGSKNAQHVRAAGGKGWRRIG
jgi:hypothetical protein